MLFIHFCFFHWQFLLYITVHAWISLLYIHNDSLSRTVKSHTKQHVLLKRSLFFNDHYQGMSYFGKCDKAANTFDKINLSWRKNENMSSLFFFLSFLLLEILHIFFLFFCFLFAFYLQSHVLFRWYLFVIFYEINLAYHN